ncbi:hypothetical protein PLICRDRAFT_299805 [Plicaturopsis crispa FD-325 SS-3]|nr:hypothetical protein PLICRDRAFT_299805 [Plicaturopsis crispa FD-325 SS-3]
MDVVEAAREKIDEEIEALLRPIRPIRALRTKRNALAPIHRLPTELLSEIFVYAARANWKGLTSVCSHWRYISLKCPLLWSQLLNPYHLRREWTELVLKRSKNSPICLDLNGWLDQPTESTDLAIQHASRAYRITLWGNRAFLAGATDKIGGPAPRLEFLRVHRDPPVEEDDVPFMLHQSFCNSSPRLQSLDLVGCAFRWDRPFSTCLTFLSVVQPSSRHNPQTRLTISQLLRIVKEAPGLQSLRLDKALRDDRLDTVPDGLRINLPQLMNLQHEDDISTSVFLRHIIFPSSTMFRIDWSVGSADPIATVSTALGAFNGTSVCAANKLDVSRRSTVAVISYEGPGRYPLSFRTNKYLEMILQVRSEWAYSSLLSVLLGRFEFTNLSHLCVAGNDLSAEDWDGYLATSGGLSIIHAGGNACHGLVEALTVDDAPDAPVPAPKLCHLQLADVDLNDDLTFMLDNCLHSRRARNAGVSQLKFDHCNHSAFGSGDDVSAHFRLFAPQVEWN